MLVNTGDFVRAVRWTSLLLNLLERPCSLVIGNCSWCFSSNRWTRYVDPDIEFIFRDRPESVYMHRRDQPAQLLSLPTPTCLGESVVFSWRVQNPPLLTTLIRRETRPSVLKRMTVHRHQSSFYASVNWGNPSTDMILPASHQPPHILPRWHWWHLHVF